MQIDSGSHGISVARPVHGGEPSSVKRSRKNASRCSRSGRTGSPRLGVPFFPGHRAHAHLGRDASGHRGRAEERPGADAVLVITPFYSRPTQHAGALRLVLDHLAREFPNLPIIIYNDPDPVRPSTSSPHNGSVTGCDVPTTNIVGIKIGRRRGLRARGSRRVSLRRSAAGLPRLLWRHVGCSATLRYAGRIGFRVVGHLSCVDERVAPASHVPSSLRALRFVVAGDRIYEEAVRAPLRAARALVRRDGVRGDEIVNPFSASIKFGR